MTKVDESSKEYDSQRRAIVFDELSDISLEKIAFANDTTPVAKAEYEQGDHDCNVCGSLPCQAPLSREYLDALLEIDEGNVEAEDVAGEACDVGEAIASIGNGEDPVHDE